MAEASRDGSMKDRISALPDELLIHVLSHLPSREAVHTCVLARRWRGLWQWVPCIDVSFKEFAEDDDEYEDGDDFEFKKFVNRLLMRRRPVDLEAFRLEYRSPTDPDYDDSADANLWIAHVLQYKAQAVKVANYHELLQLAPAVFTSEYLKRLHIRNANLIQGFFKHLQMGCPVLEYLFLSKTDIQDLDIFSSTLKALTFADAVTFSSVHKAQPSISAPNLISLSFDLYRHPFPLRLPVLKNMTSLETASIVLLLGERSDCNADDIKQFLGELSRVRSLNFCYGLKKVEMENNYRWCPTFGDLINLMLDSWCVHGDFYGLIVFLQNSPSLKKLTLELYQPEDQKQDIPTITGELGNRSFTCEQLEIVEIICLEENDLLPGVNQFLLELNCTSFVNIVIPLSGDIALYMYAHYTHRSQPLLKKEKT